MALKHVMPLKLSALPFLLPVFLAGYGASVAPLIVSGVLGLGLLIAGMSQSRCPHCRRYLSHKQNWIGRFCPHCGKKITRDDAR